MYVKFNAGNLRVDVEECSSQPRTSWSKASDEARNRYKANVAAKLEELEIPGCIFCMDLHCNEHTDSISDYTTAVLESVEAAARDSLPVSTPSTRGRCKPSSKLPGWSELVKPFYEESKFWHKLWESAGKPRQGQLLQLMNQSKQQYKYALRRVQRAKNKIQNDKFATGLLTGGVNIFTEIKKFRGNTKGCSSTVDGEVGASNIANNFADQYRNLYNQAETGASLTNLKVKLDKEIMKEDLFEVHRVTESVVKQGLNLMKANKSDAIFDFQSDCLIEGPPQLVTHLTKLLQLFLSHGYVPELILVCTLLPLVKDNLGDLSMSDNYRAIAASSQVLKLLDIVILILEGEKLGCDQLQFGFQPKASTTM